MPEGTALAPYWSKGFQEMADSCTGARSKIPCRDMCTAAGQIARGVNLTCLTTGWSVASRGVQGTGRQVHQCGREADLR